MKFLGFDSFQRRAPGIIFIILPMEPMLDIMRLCAMKSLKSNLFSIMRFAICSASDDLMFCSACSTSVRMSPVHHGSEPPGRIAPCAEGWRRV